MVVVLSGCLDLDKTLNICLKLNLCNFSNQLYQDITKEINVTLEDARTIWHLSYTVSQGFQHIVVALNDTYVLISCYNHFYISK